MCMVSRSV